MDSPTTIIAFAGEDDRYRRVSDYAARTAQARDARLVLYDIDAAGLQAPLPTFWSAEGTQEVFERGLLTPAMLEGVGRHELAAAVQRYANAGVETFGWLPASASITTLADYAASQHANLIVVPEHSDHRSLLDRLRGRDTSDLPEETGISVAVVGEAGVVAVA